LGCVNKESAARALYISQSFYNLDVHITIGVHLINDPLLNEFWLCLSAL